MSTGATRTIKYLFTGVIGLAVLFGFGYLGGKVLAGRTSLTPTPSATATAVSSKGSQWAPMKAPVPATSDCKGCHTTGAPAKPNVPRMAHPAEGWTNCTACHTDGGLVQTAPGHSGIHKEACLMCHQPPANGGTGALPRPHHLDTGAECVTCHNDNGKAPFPTTMEGRKNCWVCHPAADSNRLFANTASKK